MRTEATPNVYETSAVGSQHSYVNFPLADMPNDTADMGTVGECRPQVNNASVPPVYAVVHRRPKPVVATDNDITQPSESRPRSSANDFTLIDNDLYGYYT